MVRPERFAQDDKRRKWVTMDFEQTNERVKVVAVFDENVRASCRPVKFIRSNKQEIKITEVGLVHPQSDGVHTRHVFDVTDGSSDYRLELNAQTLVWRLTWIGDKF